MSTADRDAEMVRCGRRAVARWASFPVGADPRPVVLLHEPVRVDGGFASTDAKVAFYQGAVEAADGVVDEAVRSLREVGVRMSRPPRAALRVTAAVLSDTEFATDRGRQRLPAWKLEATDALGPIWMLTEQGLAGCWSPPETPGEERLGPHLLSRATVGPDDRQLVVMFVGGSERLFHYDVEVVESAAAVCVVPLQRLASHLPAGTAITMEGHLRQVGVTVAEPLDGRVLVNLDGTPVPVSPT